PDYVLVDGNRDPKIGIPTATIVKGDGKAACIAAASILSKVTRDRLLVEMDKAYPEYGFAKHKGYPTKAHYAAIAEHGISPEHRRSFLKNLSEHI
ncbi:MAG: ribonuclease HII, partial [Oscillospiraceae bacterium]|nr:ribonuclease HII [Oscillospiraceae bacterium]